ncbi:hypothetical protein COCVIDRAFT_33154 [Bipolaris victoriae FI3]|uniref:MYND-type domain-containing protein n=1 Tax=Bipolaris victoriae (strain FI3) TaxID=930091 RepID=W7EZF1_BIPV3|nr:hypothetical protein COCVIDRAFT_33154 [Bipolaris victoriae FI3]
MAPAPQKICVVCGDPATSKCPDCKSDTYSRYYCGKTCQETDWPAHKKRCRDFRNRRLEKKLERITDILQQVYYIFRKNTWDVPVAAIMVRGDCVEIHPSLSQEPSFFSKFPDHLPMSEQKRNTILSAFSCNDPLAYFKDMISASLEGMDVKVEECKATLGKITQKVVFRTSGEQPVDCSAFAHEILRITVPGKRWIIDITGAQFGIHKTLWAWDDYKNEHHAKIGMIYKFGTNEILVKALSNVEAMILKNDDEYEATKLSFLSSMDVAVRSFVAANRFETEIRKALEYELSNPGMSDKMISTVADVFTLSLFIGSRGRNSR